MVLRGFGTAKPGSITSVSYLFSYRARNNESRTLGFILIKT
jgi:hypothetical protein